jgi:hypothetical protein
MTETEKTELAEAVLQPTVVRFPRVEADRLSDKLEAEARARLCNVCGVLQPTANDVTEVESDYPHPFKVCRQCQTSDHKPVKSGKRDWTEREIGGHLRQ